jgi:MFS family permease
MSKEKEFSLTNNDFGVKGWCLIIFSFFNIAVNASLVNDSLNVVLSVFAETRQWDINLLYGFASIASWIGVVGAIFWGFLSGKITARVAWGISLFATAVGCVFWGFVPNTAAYFICLAIVSFSAMAFGYIANLNVIGNWFPRKKGIAMGLVTIGFEISVIGTVPMTGKLLGIGGLPGVYIFYACVTFVLGLICLIFVRDYPEQAGAFPDNDKSFDKETAAKAFREGIEYMKTSPWKVGKLLRTKQTWQLAIALGILELFSIGIMTNFVPRCLQAGLEMGTILQMLFVSGMIAIPGSYGCGQLDARIGPKKAIIVTLIIGCIAVVLNLTAILPLMYISLVFLGIELGGAANYLVSICTTIWGRYDFPLAYKVVKPMVAIGGGLGIGLVGIIGHTVSYSVAYMVLGGLMVIAIIIMATVNDSLIGRNV